MSRIRMLALYLPQFHPIPENNEWWGDGFTEWTNVTQARPMFRGHYQPHIPADLGFYDLRVPEIREAQAAMAREYGIEAFCYYHYWFAGKRLLERPFNEVLASGAPDFPFCLCWANETWSGVWHGVPDRVLIEQTYPGERDHRNHFDFVRRAFEDQRYVTIDGKPIFFVYKPLLIPDLERFAALWRTLARQAGFPGLHLVGVDAHKHWIPTQHGFDAFVNSRLPVLRREVWQRRSQMWRRIAWPYIYVRGLPTFYKYETILPSLLHEPRSGIESYPCVIPSWDNTPRSRANGLVLHQSTPELFRKHLRTALEMVRHMPEDHRIIILKSWNEWGEGNHVEPDRRFGRRYLEVIREELPGTDQQIALQYINRASEIFRTVENNHAQGQRCYTDLQSQEVRRQGNPECVGAERE